MPSVGTLKKRNPLLNWPPWYEPSVDDSSVDDYSLDDCTIIEDQAFASILDRIIGFTDWNTLNRLRRVSQQFRRHVDTFQLRHIVLRKARPRSSKSAWAEPEHFDVHIRGLNGRVIPVFNRRVRLTTSTGSVAMHQAEAQLFDMMNKHTRVLDLVGGFDEYALGCLSFSNLQYLRVIPDDGQYVSSFPFPARTLVLFASDLPLHPTRVDHRSRMHRPSAKVVVVHDGDSPFEPNGYWPGLVRGSSLGRASPASQMVFIFQPQIKSTARGRLGFGTNFWANAFHLETFDDEWLSVCKPPMTVTLAHVLGIAGDQPRWPITLVGLKTVGNQGHHLRSSGHKSVTTAACELIG